MNHEYWIDTHAHIYSEEFRADQADMIARAQETLVHRIYMPNVDHRSVDAMLEVEHRFPETCVAMMGLHPCSVKKDFQRELYVVEDWLAKRKFCAIGEIGTDLYWDKSFWDEQKEAFNIQVQWAKKFNIPVIIHCRESIDQTIELVQALASPDLTGIFHCFTGTAEQAKQIIQLNFLLGIGGVSTFKKSDLQNVLPEIDITHIVLETDSPYLAPTPHRGKRNEPSYLPTIGGRVAELKKLSVEEVRRQTTLNALKLFQEKH